MMRVGVGGDGRILVWKQHWGRNMGASIERSAAVVQGSGNFKANGWGWYHIREPPSLDLPQSDELARLRAKMLMESGESRDTDVALEGLLAAMAGLQGLTKEQQAELKRLQALTESLQVGGWRHTDGEPPGRGVNTQVTLDPEYWLWH